MIVEITGIGYPNKGAELMLCAVAEHVLQNWGDDVIVATSPMLGSDLGYRALTEYGCHQRVNLIWKGFDLGTSLGNLAPKKLLRTYGVIAEKEVDLVLDASGLRYTDKWGIKTIQNANWQYSRVKKRGGKVILLPQAFGPFENPEIQKEMQALHDNVDLIYVRDKVSMRHLQEVLNSSEKLRLKPDFTGLVAGVIPRDAENYRGKFAVIPNARMVDKTTNEVAENYFKSICLFIDECHAAGHEAFLLNHEGVADEALCYRLLAQYNGKLNYSGTRSAKEVKGIISVSTGVMTSRFHGLVSALMQGIPALSTSWNHKYECLLEDFGLEACLAEPAAGEASLRELYKGWFVKFNQSEVKVLREQLVNAASNIRGASTSMWLDIEEFCGLSRATP